MFHLTRVSQKKLYDKPFKLIESNQSMNQCLLQNGMGITYRNGNK